MKPLKNPTRGGGSKTSRLRARLVTKQYRGELPHISEAMQGIILHLAKIRPDKGVTVKHDPEHDSLKISHRVILSHPRRGIIASAELIDHIVSDPKKRKAAHVKTALASSHPGTHEVIDWDSNKKTATLSIGGEIIPGWRIDVH